MNMIINFLETIIDLQHLNSILKWLYSFALNYIILPDMFLYPPICISYIIYIIYWFIGFNVERFKMFSF